MKRRNIASTPLAPAALVFALSTGALLADGLENGDFEVIDGWLTVCREADRAPPDYSEAAASTGEQGFRIGRTLVGPPRDGCTGGTVAHVTFPCAATGDKLFCTFTFSAKFTSTDNEVAELEYVDGNTIRRALIPPTAGFRTFRYSGRDDRPEPPWIRFSLTDGDTPGVQSTLCVDAVTCGLTSRSMTNQGVGIAALEVSDEVLVVFPGPRPPEEDSSYSVPSDCNRNDRSDASDISLGRSPDDNGDGIPDECSEPQFQRGDADADGALNLTDAVVVLDYLFVGQAVIRCDDAADADDSGKVNLSDPIYALNFLFRGGPELPEPVSSCGPDRTGDDLRCAIFSPCLGPPGTFFGRRAARDSVVLVLDGSRSMRDGFCFERVLLEAAGFLAGLGPGRGFGLVVFDNVVHRYPETGGPTAADDKGVAGALDFLGDLAAPDDDGACPRDGLFEALLIANGARQFRRVELFFASHLLETCRGADREQYFRQTASEVTLRNFRRHPIHAFGLFPQEVSSRQNLLDALAGGNGGTLTNLGICE